MLKLARAYYNKVDYEKSKGLCMKAEALVQKSLDKRLLVSIEAKLKVF